MADLHENSPPDAQTRNAFLAFLGRDIEQNAARLFALDAASIDRIKVLTCDVDMDIEAPLPVEHD